jgi:hypothetical protein
MEIVNNSLKVKATSTSAQMMASFLRKGAVAAGVSRSNSFNFVFGVFSIVNPGGPSDFKAHTGPSAAVVTDFTQFGDAFTMASFRAYLCTKAPSGFLTVSGVRLYYIGDANNQLGASTHEIPHQEIYGASPCISASDSNNTYTIVRRTRGQWFTIDMYCDK